MHDLWLLSTILEAGFSLLLIAAQVFGQEDDISLLEIVHVSS
jgi:hypothetical protein